MITKIKKNAQTHSKNAQPKFLGIAIHDIYTASEEEYILKKIRDIQAKYQLSSTLLDFATSSTSIYQEINLSNNLVLKIGEVSSFSNLEMAMIILEQSRIYADRATMGSCFPRHDLSHEENLIATFLEGRKESVIVSLQYHFNGKRKMIGGCILSFNDSQKKLLDVVTSSNGMHSVIPTFQSLQLQNVDAAVIKKFEQIEEEDIVNPIRFWKQDKDTIQRLNIQDRALAQQIVASIPFACEQFCIWNNRTRPYFVVVDTHDKHVVTFMKTMFGALYLTDQKNIVPSKDVLTSILKYHYGDTTVGGYKGHIVILYLEMDLFTHKSRALFPLLYKDKLKNQTSDRCFVFNLAEKEDQEKVNNIYLVLDKVGTVTEEPYHVAVEEMNEFIATHAHLPSDETSLLEHFVNEISTLAPRLGPSSLKSLLTPIAHDFSQLLFSIRKNATTVEKDSRYIYMPHKRVLAKYIGPNLHRSLSQTRFLGLIPLTAVEKIRHLRIGSIGASVAAGSLDQLVSIGAEHIDAYDESTLAPSNQPRMPGGSFLDNGKSKVETIINQLTERNPYGYYHGYRGKVIPDEKSRTSENDITFELFAETHDIFLEVADAPHIKAGFRKYLADHYPTKPIFFIADVGNNPFSNLEIPEFENFFGQHMDYDQLNELSLPPKSAGAAMNSVYKMVKDHFPSDHKVQFLLARLGLSGFWSQTPISMRESAAITAKLLILHVLGESVSNQNIRSKNSPTQFFSYSHEDIRVIEKLYEQIFPK